MTFTPPQNPAQSMPGGDLEILQFVQDDHESLEQIRKIALRHHKGLIGAGLAKEGIVDIVGQDGTHGDLSYDADPHLKIVRAILQARLAPASAMHDITEFLGSDKLEAEERAVETFARLEALEDGWHDGEGRAPTAEALATLKAMLKTVSSTQYAIFPMICGGIQMETCEPLAAVEFRIQASGEIIAELI